METSKKYRVVLTALSANLANVAFGTCLAWTSPVIPKLRAHTEDSPLDFKINEEDEGWITSLITLGSLCSCLIGGPVGGMIGRKWSLLSTSIFFIASFILLMIATEVWVIYLARLIQGLGTGLIVVTLPLYVGEIATDDNRGALGSLMALHLCGGILYVYCIGPYVSYMVLQWSCIAIPILFFVTFIFMPESPYFYATKRQTSEGIKSLKFLRGQSASQVEDEMAKIQAEVDEAMSKKGRVQDIFSNKGYRKALLICCGLLSLQQFSGTTVVTFNSQSIFSSAKSTLDPDKATIILGLVQLLSNLVLSEMLPVNIKSIAISIACATAFVSGFVATRWFPQLNALGPYYAFWIFGSFCIVAFLFVLFVVFETKGLSLQQIQDKLHAK